MATEEHETSTGWPLGLEIMNARLRVTESEQAQAAPAVDRPYTIQMRSISFSSFSSSNLDTESTASFFQDHSVSLGRLIGLKTNNGDRKLYFPNAIRFEEREKISLRRSCSNLTGANGVDASHGICIPLLLKMSRSRSKPRQ